jgi:hypothetical protein
MQALNIIDQEEFDLNDKKSFSLQVTVKWQVPLTLRAGTANPSCQSSSPTGCK